MNLRSMQKVCACMHKSSILCTLAPSLQQHIATHNGARPLYRMQATMQFALAHFVIHIPWLCLHALTCHYMLFASCAAGLTGFKRRSIDGPLRRSTTGVQTAPSPSIDRPGRRSHTGATIGPSGTDNRPMRLSNTGTTMGLAGVDNRPPRVSNTGATVGALNSTGDARDQRTTPTGTERFATVPALTAAAKRPSEAGQSGFEQSRVMANARAKASLPQCRVS